MVTIDDSLVAYQNDQLQRVPKAFHRYMYDRFPWKERMVGLVGPRSFLTLYLSSFSLFLLLLLCCLSIGCWFFDFTSLGLTL